MQTLKAVVQPKREKTNRQMYITYTPATLVGTHVHNHKFNTFSRWAGLKKINKFIHRALSNICTGHSRTVIRG